MLPAQTSFSAGEISPRFLARTDTRGYKEGAAALENMVALAQGPAARRGGIRFAIELPPGIIRARIVPFPVAADDYFIAVFYDQKVLMLNKVGEPLNPELVLNSEFNAGAANWTAVAPGGATVVFSLISATLTSTVGQTAALRQQLAGLVPGTTYRLRPVQLAPLDNVRLRVGTVAGGAQQGEVISNLISPVLTFVATVANHWIEIASPDPGVALVISSISVQVTGTPLAPLASPITDDAIMGMQYEMAPDGNRMVVVSGAYAPQ
jgi:hypothetical protein